VQAPTAKGNKSHKPLGTGRAQAGTGNIEQTVNSECYKQSATVRVIIKGLQAVVQRCYSGCETAKDQQSTIAKWQQDKSPHLGVKAGTSLTS